MNRTRSTFVTASLLAAMASASAPRLALADDVALPDLPTTQPDGRGKGKAAAAVAEPDIALDVEREIDLANVVTSAAKGVTTVQEAPSIITIITAEEIRARGYRFINQALQQIPGFQETSGEGIQVAAPFIRGIGQGALLLRDGVAMFDPYANIGAFNRSIPMETIKRIEVVTGPGGVLWGANSFLGIVNVISKEADDTNGLEVSAGGGHGDGEYGNFRAYAMFGKSFFRRKLKIFQHVSYETFVGPRYSHSTLLASSPAPNPSGPAYYSANTDAVPQRSWLVTIDGRFSYGPVTLYYNVPLGEWHPGYGFSNVIVPKGNRFDIWDRYGVLEYKDRFLKDRIGLTMKGYYTQFVRQFAPQIYPQSSILPSLATFKPGGLNFDITNHLIQRAGGTVDLDFTLPYNIRLLFGGEMFWESMTGSTTFFRAPQPENVPVICPVDSTGMPLPNCPRQFINNVNRIVGAVYLNAQWRPIQKLSFDAGVRLQGAFGGRGYGLVPLGSASIVWNFAGDFHIKANYASGFRAPVFQATDGVFGGVQFGPNPKLRNETSQSFQGEINGRILRNTKQVRELELRVDYSYTLLRDLIQITNGTYGNTGRRAIHAVEAFARLYLQGDHTFSASYTFLAGQSTDTGQLRGSPNHWFAIGGTFSIVKRVFDLNANLNVFGAYEDPNRVPTGPGPFPDAVSQARSTDLVWDRLTPVASLQLGARVRFFKEKLALSAQFYNVLNQKYWFPDYFYDLTPTTEMSPTQAPGFNFFASITYRP